MQELAEKTFVTNDLSFAAYLLMNNMELLSAQKLGRTYKFQFRYLYEIERLKFQYVGSESSKFDDSVRKLKRVLFSDTMSNNDE